MPLRRRCPDGVRRDGDTKGPSLRRKDSLLVLGKLSRILTNTTERKTSLMNLDRLKWVSVPETYETCR